MSLAMKFLSALLLMGATTTQAQDLPANFNFDGVLVDLSDNPLPGPVNLQFDIYNPAENCLLYREVLSSVALDANGAFSVKVGSGTRDTAADGNVPYSQIFQNSGVVRSAGTNCSVAYTPAANDGRMLRVTVDGVSLTPSYSLSPVPMATVAQTLNGKSAADFIQANPTTSQILRFSDGNNHLGFTAPGSIPSSLIWTLPSMDGSNGQVLTTDGAGILSWSTAGASGITSLNGSTGLNQTFAFGTTGMTPAWSTAGDIHSINIPMANTVGVTAGLVSNAEYDLFNSKLTSVAGSVLNSGMIWVGDASNSAQPALLSGDATISNTGVLDLGPTGVSPGTYNGITVDIKGRVVTASPLTSNDIPTLDYLSLMPTTLPGGPSAGMVAFDNIDNRLKFYDGLYWVDVGSDDLSAIIDGNTLGIPMTIGTNDNQSLHFETNGIQRITVDANGNVGIGTAAPDDSFVVFNGSTYGRYTATGWTHSSDMRLKHDISPLENSLEKVLQLEGVSYKFNSDPENKTQVGFIAQKVEPIFPEVVTTDKKGIKSMAYGNLVAPVVEAIKEQQRLIQHLEEENRSLRAYLCSKDPEAPICH